MGSNGNNTASRKLTFRFLDLPPEIRNEIYYMVLVDNKGVELIHRVKIFRHEMIRVYPSLYRKGIDFGRKTLSPHLLVANRQVHLEAQPILYQQHIILSNVTTLYYFLFQIGDNVRLLDDISILKLAIGNQMALLHAAFCLLTKAELQGLYIAGVTTRAVPLNDDAKRCRAFARHFFMAGSEWLKATEKLTAAGKNWRNVLSLVHDGKIDLRDGKNRDIVLDGAELRREFENLLETN